MQLLHSVETLSQKMTMGYALGELPETTIQNHILNLCHDNLSRHKVTIKN